ncbi:C39 family peptidase [Micromonospora sp. MS34]|uniref:C39 family peptidase n=1 Tax=Micromonospora sp. MS34 TaxID=3385971 RepID=UPI0039A13076
MRALTTSVPPPRRKGIPIITFTRRLSEKLTIGIVRKGTLGVAGLAFAGGVLAGPGTAAEAAAPQADKPSTAAQPDKSKTDKRAGDYTFEAQPNFYYCGPASTRIALSAQGNLPSQDELAEKLGTTQAGTPSAFDITRVLNEELGAELYRTGELPTDSVTPEQVQRMKADLKAAIDDDRVAVVNVIGAGTDLDGIVRSFPGHYLTVVAYEGDGERVKIADPWQPVGDGTYWMDVEELANWAASRGYSA